MAFLIKLNLKSFDNISLNIYCEYLKKIFTTFTTSNSIVTLPNKKKIVTLLKSPHVNKSAREQFLLKIFKKQITIKQQINPRFLKLLVINKPKHINLTLKIVKQVV